MDQIIVGRWFPVPTSRPDLADVAPIDTIALEELVAELQAELPEYEIVLYGHAMAGMHGPPPEVIRWYTDIQLPLEDIAKILIVPVISRVVERVMQRYYERKEAKASSYDEPGGRPLPQTAEEAARTIGIYGPDGVLIARVGEDPEAMRSRVHRKPYPQLKREY
jgi:hypothetical protein